MFIPKHQRSSVLAAWLSDFFDPYVQNLPGFNSAHFVDSTGYRLNMYVENNFIDNEVISFEHLDEFRLRIAEPEGKLKHYFDQLRGFLAKQDQTHYRSLLVLQHNGKRCVRAFCGKIEPSRPCAELYAALQIPHDATSRPKFRRQILTTEYHGGD